jgi:hypothetical protein
MSGITGIDFIVQQDNDFLPEPVTEKTITLQIKACFMRFKQLIR